MNISDIVCMLQRWQFQTPINSLPYYFLDWCMQIWNTLHYLQSLPNLKKLIFFKKEFFQLKTIVLPLG